MRHRWEVNSKFFERLAWTWTIVGIVANFVIGMVFRDHDKQGQVVGPAWVHSPLHWTGPLWIMPFAILVSALVLIGLGWGLKELWLNPPVRRITEPVLDDIRKVEHR